MCSRVLVRLKKLEEEGLLAEGQQIMVIPSVNPSSMNVAKRFWPIDNTDINRMFPGYSMGETTQRIAAGVFEVINKYRTGIQFTSFYMPGDYQPHVQMMRTGYENTDKAKVFGLPFVVIREPRPYDTATLHYNWQIWETDAYNIYSGTTSRISSEGAELAADGVERFLACSGILKKDPGPAPSTRTINYDDLLNIRTQTSGLYHSLADLRSPVTAGQKLAEIIDPCTGEVLETLESPVNGIIFFQYSAPLILPATSAFKILQDS